MRTLGPGAFGDIDHPSNALALTPLRAGYAPAAYMVLGAETHEALLRAKNAGATHAAIVAYWDRLQADEGGGGGAVDVSDLLAAITDAKALGLKVSLEVALQYPPDFVTVTDVFRDQNGQDWTGADGSGDEIYDWVWHGQGRRFVQDFLDKLLPQIPWTQISRVRLGGLQKGELQFPGDGSIRWMGFSEAAQTGDDLAAGMSRCPLPGHIPSDTPNWSDDDVTWNTWYQDSLVTWMQWLIAQYRAHFTGGIYVMHPGAGIRPVSQLPTSPNQGDNFRVNASRGLDWDRQIKAYPGINVYPHCTWMDHDHFVPENAFDPINDGNAAPWYHLLRTATKNNRAQTLWGENTGGQTAADMDRMFTTGAIASRYAGCAWLNDDLLVAEQGATYADLARNI